MATFAISFLGGQRAAAGTWWCWNTAFNSQFVTWGWVWELALQKLQHQPELNLSLISAITWILLCDVTLHHSFAEAVLAFCEKTSQISVKFLYFLIKPRFFMLCFLQPKSGGCLLSPVSFRFLGAVQSIRLCSGNNWELGVGEGLQFLLAH